MSYDAHPARLLKKRGGLLTKYKAVTHHWPWNLPQAQAAPGRDEGGGAGMQGSSSQGSRRQNSEDRGARWKGSPGVFRPGFHHSELRLSFSQDKELHLVGGREAGGSHWSSPMSPKHSLGLNSLNSQSSR